MTTDNRVTADLMRALCKAHRDAQNHLEALTGAVGSMEILSANYDGDAAIAVLAMNGPLRFLPGGKLTGVSCGLLSNIFSLLAADYVTAIPHPSSPGELAIRVQWSKR